MVRAQHQCGGDGGPGFHRADRGRAGGRAGGRGLRAAAVRVMAGVVTSIFVWPAVARAQGSPGASASGKNASDSFYIAKARADSVRHPYTQADVNFMTGMIAHHAQAIVMSKWAPTHGASPSVQTLASRIINAQTDEIAIMQNWLRDRQQPVPAATATGMKMMMNGQEQVMLMPGMLTEAQMKQLDDARGPDFDRLFLTFMIQHHQGAVTMVHNLVESTGAGQDEIVFKFAGDVEVDQTTEIARMQRMLVLQSLDMPSQ
jgi:uncharacterized protein (DUF305 family)